MGELVRYADDFVILCKRKAQEEEALKAVKWIIDKLEVVLDITASSIPKGYDENENQHLRGVFQSKQTTVEYGR